MGTSMCDLETSLDILDLILYCPVVPWSFESKIDRDTFQNSSSLNPEG
jgi:hypothetical protein